MAEQEATLKQEPVEEAIPEPQLEDSPLQEAPLQALQPAPVAAQESQADEELPPFVIDLRPRILTLPDISQKSNINVRYPLMPPYAFAHIYWDEHRKELVYDIEEQPLSDTEKELYKLITLGLEEMINISFAYASKSNLILQYIEKNVQSILLELGATVSRKSYLKIMYYLYRDFIGLNEIEPLMNDYYIEDIECNGAESPVYIVHRKYQNMRTNMVFAEQKRLTDFVEKLAQKTGRYVSFAKPLLDGTLPDGSRVNATYTSDVTTHGPTFTIRKFTKEPLSPIHLIGYETSNPEIFAYLWMAVEHKFNVMVIGETASGKTTMLNAVLQFVPTEARIVSIEDTRELSLTHENWIPSVSRSGFGIPNILGKQYGEVTLFDLLKETFRQNPDYVVVGEVRGKETYVLFQGMASIPGNEKIMVLENGTPKLIEIEKIKDVNGLKTVAFDPKTCQARIMPVAAHIRHPERKELVKFTTKTGREIITTPDHSLFSFICGDMTEVPASMLVKGDKIAIAGRIPCGYADIKELNLFDIVPNIRVYAPELVKEASHKLGYYQASKICRIASITDYYSDFARASPASMRKENFLGLMAEAGISYDSSKLKVKLLRKSRPIPSTIELTDEFLRLLGYYISEGTVNFSGKNSSVALYNKNQEVLDDMHNCMVKTTGIEPSARETHGFGIATELKIGNRIFAELINSLCGRAIGKKVPGFVFGLSKERMGQFLSGLFTGDGYTTEHSFGYTTISKELAKQVQQLLLSYGIVASLYKGKTRKGKDIYDVVFYRQEYKEEFLKHVKVLGRKPFRRKRAAKFTRKIADVYIDRIKAAEKISLKEGIPVYDLSVPGPENFMSASGIILHNSGHPSYSTFHAASVETVLRRLETPPINLPASLVDSLDIVVSVIHIKDQRRNVRRVKDVKEIIEVKQSLGQAETNTVFEWNPISDTFVFNPNSHILQLVSRRTGIPLSELQRELLIRAELLRKMQERNIINHDEVANAINQYYKDPDSMMKEYGIQAQTTMRPEDVKAKIAAEKTAEQEKPAIIAKPLITSKPNENPKARAKR